MLIVKFLLPVIIFCFFYYLLIYIFFKVYQVKEETVLAHRLGTILWHSSDLRKGDTPVFRKNHVYCYYPKGEAMYRGKSGEYVIKKVNSIDDCKNWLGIAIFKENYWISEREKIQNLKNADLTLTMP